MDIQATVTMLGPRFQAVAEDAALAFKELALPAGASLLDVGTGSGNFAIYAALRGYRVVTGEPGTDTSQYAGKDWALAAKKAGVLDKIQFQAFDAGRMPFAAGAFDAVCFFGVLHHIDEGVRFQAFREALRVAKPDGWIVFFEPRAEMLEKLWVDDPNHPLAADPSAYLPEPSLREQRIEGSLMNIFLYRKGTRS
jgi:SAM-dependent methyltransferase